MYAIFIYLDTNRSGIDPAGKGMAMGFLFIGLVYLALLIGLNFININWVRILVLILAGVPLLILISGAIDSWQTHKKFDKQKEEYSKFQDPHLNAMVKAMQDNDLIKMRELLVKDNSQLNKVGVNNRQSILGIALRKSWVDDRPEASDFVSLILENGADPNIFHPDTYGTYTPLAQYGKYAKVSVFKALLDAGANPNALEEHSVPLVYVLMKGNRDDLFEKVKLLLEYGLDPNIPLGNDQPYKLNFSPLIQAAVKKQWSICNLLIDYGADVDFQPASSDGRTFWFLLDESSKEYQESGDIPADFEQLLSNDKIKSRN